ncbi:MAG: hypothetical protein NVV74_05520 [Magnetospirillum sp.]|nr:hypothetical protein [Magnetospirillum sp.]
MTRTAGSASSVKGRCRSQPASPASTSSRTGSPASKAAATGLAASGLATCQPGGGSSRATPSFRSPAVVMAACDSSAAASRRDSSLAP